MTRWRAVRILALAAAVVLMVVLVARLGPRAIVQQLGAAGPGALWLLVVYSAGTTIGAIPWYVLLPDDARPSPRAAIASRFAASGANTIVPLFGFGGEAVRLLWLRPQDRAAGVGATVIDRLLYAVASSIFLLGGVIAAVRLVAMPRTYVVGAAVGALALFGLSGAAIWVAARHRVANRIHSLVRRVRRQPAPADGVSFGDDVDTILETTLERRGRVVLAVMIHVIGRIALGAEVYVGFLVLGVPLPLDAALAFAAVPVLLAFVGAVVPSQIGIQEGAQALVATALGIAPATAVAVVLLQRIRQLVTAGIGWLLIAAIRTSNRAAAAAIPPA